MRYTTVILGFDIFIKYHFNSNPIVSLIQVETRIQRLGTPQDTLTGLYRWSCPWRYRDTNILYKQSYILILESVK